MRDRSDVLFRRVLVLSGFLLFVFVGFLAPTGSGGANAGGGVFCFRFVSGPHYPSTSSGRRKAGSGGASKGSGGFLDSAPSRE